MEDLESGFLLDDSDKRKNDCSYGTKVCITIWISASLIAAATFCILKLEEVL
tara:strand:- start:1081 stop:1236 length:156 start_codon:yes stop_codon:yes gene_type:complete